MSLGTYAFIFGPIVAAGLVTAVLDRLSPVGEQEKGGGKSPKKAAQGRLADEAAAVRRAMDRSGELPQFAAASAVPAAGTAAALAARVNPRTGLPEEISPEDEDNFAFAPPAEFRTDFSALVDGAAPRASD